MTWIRIHRRYINLGQADYLGVETEVTENKTISYIVAEYSGRKRKVFRFANENKAHHFLKKIFQKVLDPKCNFIEDKFIARLEEEIDGRF